MEYIQNCASWVTADLLKILEINEGDHIPVWQPNRWQGNSILDTFREKARPHFEKQTPMFHQFDKNNPAFKNFHLELPVLPKTRKNLHWWFIKLLPGEMQTLHIDPHLLDVNNPVRYTMFLQNYEPGHIFMYEDYLATNYKKGDLFEWSDPMLIHGCVNISYNIRYTLQITLFD